MYNKKRISLSLWKYYGLSRAFSFEWQHLWERISCAIGTHRTDEVQKNKNGKTEEILLSICHVLFINALWFFFIFAASSIHHCFQLSLMLVEGSLVFLLIWYYDLFFCCWVIIAALRMVGLLLGKKYRSNGLSFSANDRRSDINMTLRWRRPFFVGIVPIAKLCDGATALQTRRHPPRIGCATVAVDATANRRRVSD